jgi:3-oxoadipate enol-lactonase
VGPHGPFHLRFCNNLNNEDIAAMIIRNIIARLFTLYSCILICVFSYSQTHDAQKCGFVPAGKLKIHCCVSGQGPAIIFLHAGFLDMHLWDKQVAELNKDHRVIIMDLPGHGQSTGVDTTIKIAGVINKVMETLKISSASIVGISLGASCAVDFALAYPAKTSRLLLCSPGLNGWQQVMKMDSLSKKLYLREDSFFDTQEPNLVTENFVHFWLDGPYRKTASVDAAVRDYVTRTAAEKIRNSGGSGPVFDRKKAANRLKLIRKPVLILYGSLDIPFIGHVSRYLQKNIKGAQLRMIPGTGHLLNLEKPDLFNSYLKSWTH